MKKWIVLGLLMLTGLSLMGCDSTTTVTTTTTALELLERGTVATDQTIYIEAGSDGEAESMIVVSRIPRAVRGTYWEYGNFASAENLSGVDPLRIETGQLAIPVISDGKDHYYRATLAEGYEPPFLLSFSYAKNGLPVDPIAEKGKAGTYVVEIQIADNPEAEDGFRNQFMCQLQVSVPAVGTAVVDSAGGTVLLAGGSFTIGFMTLPGTSAEYSLTLETDSFTIGSIQASFLRFDPAILGSDLSGFGVELRTLVDGLSALRDGQTTLKDGLNTMSSALASLASGSGDASDGLTQLTEGVSQLANSAELLAANLELVSNGAAQLQTSGSALLGGYAGLMAAVTDVYGTFSVLHADDPELMTKLVTLSQTATAIETALEAYVGGVDGCAAGLVPLSEGMNQLASALRTTETSLAALAAGEAALSGGLNEIDLALAGLPASVQTMIDAQTLIIDGLEASLANFDFLFSDPEPTVSFTSAANPAPNSIQFIYSVRGF